MTGWFDDGELDAMYDRTIRIDGKKPVAIEVRRTWDECRFLFEKPTDREMFQWIPGNNKHGGFAVYAAKPEDE